VLHGHYAATLAVVLTSANTVRSDDDCLIMLVYVLSQVQFRLLPGSDHKLSYNLYPLVPGHVILPKLHLNLPRFQTNWDEHAQKMIPTQVFIKVL
jgi:hypothetical protein